MKIDYGSFAYCFYLTVTAGIIALLYFLLRKRSDFAKKALILALMAVNILQHLLKSVVWPHNRGGGFNYTNTAYNVCALLILVAPFVFLLTKRDSAFRQFAAYVGTVGAGGALVFPMWFIGQTMWQWEFIRSWYGALPPEGRL